MGYQACSDCISNCQRKHSKEKSSPHGHAKEAAAANELEKPAFMKKMLEGPMTSTMVHPHRILPHLMYHTCFDATKIHQAIVQFSNSW
jgi:hypothetical protein